MKVLHHPEEGDAEVEATLDPMTIDCSMGLVSEEVSLVGKVIVAAETGAGVCSVVGASDPVEGSSKTLCIFLRRRGTMGSSIGVCSALPWKTKFVEPSRIGTKEPSIINRGPLSQASPTVRLLGKNLGRRM
nr:hypothetical protein CFP56_38534 [Quercus suber]